MAAVGLHRVLVSIAVGLGAFGAGLAAAGQAAFAQQEGGAEVLPRSPVLMVDRNRMFQDSLFGKASEARFQAESQALISENQKLEAALEAEERDLTDRRPTMAPEQFQKLAAEFDQKAEAIRKAQDAKSRSITSKREEDRQRFLQAAVPVLGEIMGEAGAVAIFDKEMVILSLRDADITEEAIARIDARLGDGSAMPLPEEPAPVVPEAPAGEAPAPAP